jgi:peptidoglycan/xylan/chitin deacetylase (PgdA/CDA1 family)
MRHVLLDSGCESMTYRCFWPAGARFAFVLTHDIETAQGQAFARAVADLEEGLGFRSSFNFVPERYPLDLSLIDELRARGFEIGIHGLKHDGLLFSSRDEFDKRASRINDHLRAQRAVGFRAPLFHRQPEWMQILDVEYDLSFFDTDPYEPLPGGTMSLWPFTMGKLLELPLTLVEDYTLASVLCETTPRVWLEKIAFIDQYAGLALANTHPDYLRDPGTWRIYASLLEAMRTRNGYWSALPHEVARWWRRRTVDADAAPDPDVAWGEVALADGGRQLVLTNAANTCWNPHQSCAARGGTPNGRTGEMRDEPKPSGPHI